jgi:hypothetical protein
VTADRQTLPEVTDVEPDARRDVEAPYRQIGFPTLLERAGARRCWTLDERGERMRNPAS